jgi:hypothetical protein
LPSNSPDGCPSQHAAEYVDRVETIRFCHHAY